MKGRALLLDVGPAWEAAALIEDGRLEDLLLRPAEERCAPAPEALFAARVARLAPKTGVAFAALPGGAQAFLNAPGQVSQGRVSQGRVSQGRVSQGRVSQGKVSQGGVLKGQASEGETLRLEIRTHPEAGKAWPATEKLGLRGRRLSLTPGAPGLNVSRAISDEARRAALRAAMGAALEGEADLGCVARTAAERATPQEIAAEAAWLLSRWRALEASASAPAAPALLQAAPGPAALALREWRAEDAEILATPRSGDARSGALSAALERTLSPSDPLRDRVSAAEPTLFERFDVAGQALAALDPRAALGRGAWLAIEPTAALTAIDVNSGPEMSALAADLAAAAAAPRLLRLRGSGGLIAIDFISQGAEPRAKIARALEAAARRDAVPLKPLGWTRGGVLEATRKRARRPLDLLAIERWMRESM
ncbi:MAG: ribonuclease E/G [Pseudomonadota bacterium]